MKAVILAGGLGTRLSEETEIRPKPMVEIGGKPILWHILKIYSSFGIDEFVICLGYKGYVIKEYFANYALHMSDVTIDLLSGKLTVHHNDAEDWRVSLINTGESTMTGGRIKRILDHVRGDDCFCLTYGDGVANIDIGALVDFHRDHGGLATMTTTRPPSRFGHLSTDGDRVTDFVEKPASGQDRVNGGFFVLSPEVGRYIQDDRTVWEREPMEQLAADDQLYAFKHDGFWQPMDTLRDKINLDNLWCAGGAPWKVWE
ncbi:MAG: glucose-1-phosphate cytidylyltransferase [Alphaproteobacteria bacterium]|nr:glucose-1-phosphate cytidylyltransferase [Alphaproteobacteria bacterium]